MTRLKNIFNKVYPQLTKAVGALRRILSFSLADPVFSVTKVVCLSIESDGVYLACVEKKLWRMKIRHFKRYTLAEYKSVNPDMAALAAAAFIKDFYISRATFLLSLPRAWAIVKQVDFPVAAKEDLPRVVALELDRLTPLSADNAYHDFIILDENAQHIRILLAVVRADQVDAYLSALKARNISVEKIGLSVFMMRPMIQGAYPNTNMVFLTLKGGVYEGGAIVKDGTLQSFSGRLDPGDLSAVDAMVRHVSASMDELTQNSSPPRILVHADENHFNMIRDQFKTLPVSHLSRDWRLPAPKPDAGLSPVALGGALDWAGKRTDTMNLLNKSNRQAFCTPWILSGFLLAAMLAIAAFYFFAPLHFQQEKNDAIDRHLKALKADVRKIEALKNDVEMLENDITVINDFKKRNVSTMNIIKDMTSILPQKTWLTRLKITDKTSEIEGYSASATDIILKLENSKYFQKVEFSSPTFRDSRLNTERFVIKMDLKNEERPKEATPEIKNEKK